MTKLDLDALEQDAASQKSLIIYGDELATLVSIAREHAKWEPVVMAAVRLDRSKHLDETFEEAALRDALREAGL